jgi:hypothetical protein
MDPVFTLQWPEFILANRLQKLLPKKDGYSILIPTSRQEKGIDLAVLKKSHGQNRVVTIQIKASRTYSGTPPKRESTKKFAFYTWFNRFDVPEEADFILLFGMYAPDVGRTKPVTATWYGDCTLLFTKAEMKQLMQDCLTVGGQPDKMFGFGFDNPSAVFQTRGDKERKLEPYSDFLLEKRVKLIQEALKISV